MTQMAASSAASQPYRPDGPTRQEQRAARVERVRVAVRSLGEGFITMGVVLLLFCTYQLFWTNLSSDKQTNTAIADIKKAFVIPVAPSLPGQSTAPAKIAYGQGYGLIYIPRLGSDWVKPLIEGSSLSNLKKGLTHYQGNAQPGEIGNFAVAGHRATNGEPFRNLDRMESGDLVYVQTPESWVTYKVNKVVIVKPKDTWVLNPIPTKNPVPGVQPTEALLTMTTCNPRWASYERLIVFGKMVDKYPKTLGAPAAIRNLV